MNKTKILLPVHPEWCEKIFNGSKTIEVRHSRPKIDTPFEVLVYMTATKERFPLWEYVTAYKLGEKIVDGSQKIIGSFVCDEIASYLSFLPYDSDDELCYSISQDELAATCLEPYVLSEYGKGKTLYGWHITEPKLFDRPRELSEYALFGKCAEECDEYDFCARDDVDGRMSCKYFKRKYLTRAPQSWIYVEEV